MALIVVPGPASLDLGREVAGLLKAETVPVFHRSFPDGESYLRFEGDLAGKDVAIVQSTGPPQNTNLVQLLLMLDAARDLGARRVVAVAPYLAYARQDRRFLSGEAFSARTVMKLLEACRVDALVTVNLHNPRFLKGFRVRVENLSAIGSLARYLTGLGLEGAFSLTLGKMAPEVAAQADSVVKGGYGCIPTEREFETGKVSLKGQPLPVREKDVIIFDDIISSCGTASEAVKLVRSQGARRVYAACVHPLLAEGAMERLLGSGAAGVAATDTVPSPVSVVSVAPLIAEALRKIL